MTSLKLIALVAGFISALAFLFALEITPFPTVFQVGRAVIDNSQSSIGGVPLGSLATVKDHPNLTSLGYVCLLLSFVASLADILISHKHEA